MKDKLGGIIMKNFVNLKLKMYLSLKTKFTRKYIIARILKFDDCRNCLKAFQIEM